MVFKVHAHRFHGVRGDEGIRTLDPLLARQVLSQLSYTPRFLGFIRFLTLGSHPILFYIFCLIYVAYKPNYSSF